MEEDKTTTEHCLSASEGEVDAQHQRGKAV